MGLFHTATLLAAGIRTFLTSSNFRVEGNSMMPGLRHGDLLHVLPTCWTRGGFERGAVVVAKSPVADGAYWVKRVVGLPGEFVTVSEDGGALINDAPLPEPYRAGVAGRQRRSPPWWCDDHEYFLMGDNRAESDDSRRYGPLPMRAIIGRVWFRWPRWRAPAAGSRR